MSKRLGIKPEVEKGILEYAQGLVNLLALAKRCDYIEKEDAYNIGIKQAESLVSDIRELSIPEPPKE